MAEIVNMPKLGFDMAEGILVRWVISEGQNVTKGEVLAEIETDKATVEVESSGTGVILRHIVSEGTPVPVGDPIAVLGEAGEEVDIDSLVGAAPPPAAAPQSDESTSPAPAEAPVAIPEPALSSGNGADGRFPGGVKASPVARRLAADRAIDLQQVPGSGPGGRIVKRDVEAALASGATQTSTAPLPAAVPIGEPLQTQRIPMSKLRAAIGRRMTASKQQLPHFYVTSELDAAPLMALRTELNQMLGEDQPKISVNDFIVRSSSLTLREYPNLNTSLDGEEFVRHGDINIGIAVAVDDGLLTVVVHNADLKSIRTISQEARESAGHAREGLVRPEEIEGATFTTSNLGMFDVDHFIAIINPPQSAILAIGGVRETPIVQDGELAIGQRLKVTLSADHRVTDGAEAAQWLQLFRSYIEEPLRLLL